LLCTFTYYLIVQLGTSLACVAIVTDLKKRRAQELTAGNCIATDSCEKLVVSVSTLAVDFIFFTITDEKVSR